MTGGGLERANGDEWPAEIDRSVAHAARIYDYYLGGDTHFEVDRVAAEHAAAVHPGGIETVRASVQSNRAFLIRAVTWLAGQAGICQFLDIGSGIPNGNNVHAAAQAVIPKARVVYVDNDPIVLAHAHQLLDDTSREGRVDYVQADLRAPDYVLGRAAVTLDLMQPVAVLLVGILHFFPDRDDPYGIVARLVNAVPSGSHLVVCHLASDIHGEDMAEAARRFNETTNETWVLRSRDEIARFFGGLEVAEPGVVQVDQWRPDEGPPPVLSPDGRTNPLHVGVGRKP